MSYYPQQEPNEYFWFAMILLMSLYLAGWLRLYSTAPYTLP